MKPSQEAKSAVIAQLKEKLSGAQGVVVVDYRGLTVAQISDLRRKVREVGGEMVVAKNTLIGRALDQKLAKGLAEILSGPTAVVFSPDEVSVPRVLSTFGKTAAGLPMLKGGFLSDRILTAEEVKALGAIPGREVLQGKLVGLLASQPNRLVWALNGNIQKLVSVLAEVARMKGTSA